MHLVRRMILVIFAIILCTPVAMTTYAQSNADALKSVKQKLQQQAQEKQAVNNDITNIQKEMESLFTYISNNKADMAKTQVKIDDAQQQIEQKKEEIVTLEDKMLNRKAVMKKRLVALQHDDNLSIVMKVLLDSKSIDDFLQRASAVTALFNADKDILNAQQDDLEQIEKDKKVIDEQEAALQEQQKVLAEQQTELAQNLQKRQATLATLQQKYDQIAQKMAATEKEKAGIETEIKAAQERLLREQAEARKRAAAASGSTTVAAAPGAGDEMYVTATAYTPNSSGSITALGYNIKKNPNMKLIAVDPNVIPLGSKVWVEGYGVAVAGDTGGAINGHKIDVLMATDSAAIRWGVRTVKIVILK